MTPLLSAFTISRNAEKLYFPIKPVIESVLPIVDEFIVAIDPGDEDDHTLEIVEGINDSRIKIFKRHWDEKKHSEKVLALETDFAMKQCNSVWCLYLQADEVVHEEDLKTILHYCEKYRDDLEVDGFIFRYFHMWGDYEHHATGHTFYRYEIRLVRNNAGIYSYRDAVSFRKGDNEKLKVVKIPAHIYHYGFVRPPEVMARKKKVHDKINLGQGMELDERMTEEKEAFKFGALGSLRKFKGTHPKVMDEFIKKLNWKHRLNYGKRKWNDPVNHKHEKLKNRILTWVEMKFNRDETLFGFDNYILLNKK